MIAQTFGTIILEREIMSQPLFARSIVVVLAMAVTLTTPALAVGDPPAMIGRKQAADYYRSIRPLLTNDGAACPASGLPLSGRIAGGSSPSGGSRTITLTFDDGIRVVVMRRWDRSAGSASVAITCGR